MWIGGLGLVVDIMDEAAHRQEGKVIRAEDLRSSALVAGR
jgi:hypothetical protein